MRSQSCFSNNQSLLSCQASFCVSSELEDGVGCGGFWRLAVYDLKSWCVRYGGDLDSYGLIWYLSSCLKGYVAPIRATMFLFGLAPKRRRLPSLSWHGGSTDNRYLASQCANLCMSHFRSSSLGLHHKRGHTGGRVCTAR